jgi:RNA polymerase sigma-70 factor (ECF subfamily)
MSDHSLIALYEARDERAIEGTQKQFGGYLYTVAYNILGSAQDAEECVNDTLMQLWNVIPPNHPENFYAYAATISRNLARNRYASEHAQRRGGDTVPELLDELRDCCSEQNVESEVNAHLLGEAVSRFLEGIKKKHRIIFVQRYFNHASVRDIAEQMHLRESYVTVSLTRTRQKLRTFLSEEEFI